MAELFELTGIVQVQDRLRAYSVEVTPLMALAVQQELDAILEASRGLVPVDTGSLRDSGQVDDPAIFGDIVIGGVHYGGTAGYQGRVPRNYAIRVHEDLGMRHPRGGSAKYLEIPFFAATAGMAARLADAIRIAL
jgi:hypothetical protein